MRINPSIFRAGMTLLFMAAVLALNYRDVFRSRRPNWIPGSLEQVGRASHIQQVRCVSSADLHSFVWRPKTAFTSIDELVTPDEAQPGQWVHVTFKPCRGQAVATRIEIEPV